MRRQVIFLFTALVSFGSVLTAVSDGGDGNFSESEQHQHQDFEQQQQQYVGSTFTLKVQVSDVLDGHALEQAVVEVFVDYSRTNMAVSGEDGVVVVQVPYRSGLPVTIVASRERYVPTMLPWKTSRLPIFSSVSLSLLGSKQGNIWLFEDSVLITGKTSDASSHPSARFPKNLLHLTESSDMSSLQAYLTVPRLSTAENTFLHTVGVLSRQSEYTSIELHPVAAASIQLFSSDTEVHINGSIQLTLPLHDNYRPPASSAVPAWFFNTTTGGWMRKGLGTVTQTEGKPMWIFTAPHLGYWMAAPLSSTSGFVWTRDLMSQHWSFFMAVLGGTLVIIIGLLLAVLCFHRDSSLSEIKSQRIHADRMPALKKDQTTSTYDNQLFEVSSGVSCHHTMDEVNQTFTEKDNLHNDSILSKCKGSVTVGPKAASEHGILDPNDDDDYGNLTNTDVASQQMKVPLSVADNKVFFYNQPVAILHAPTFFHLEEQTELWGKGPSSSQSETCATEGQTSVPEGSLQAPSSNTTNLSRSHFSLPESVSEPGAAAKTIGDNRHSCSGALIPAAELQTGNVLSPSPLPPRAWFVSLEGKPAAEIHRSVSVSEQQRRQRPADSRDTSLDSGVDMSELNQTAGKRTITLERKGTFIKSTAGGRPASDQ